MCSFQIRFSSSRTPRNVINFRFFFKWLLIFNFDKLKEISSTLLGLRKKECFFFGILVELVLSKPLANASSAKIVGYTMEDAFFRLLTYNENCSATMAKPCGEPHFKNQCSVL